MVVYSILISLLLIVLLAIGLFSRAEIQREIQQLERDLAAAQQNLLRQAEADRIREEFVANVSHELRTPLTGIRGALGLFAAGVVGTFDTKGQNLLRIAITNTDRLFRLVNDLLDLERIKSGRATLQLARCSLDDLIRHAIETVTVTADAARIRLEYTPEAAGSHPGPTDRRAAGRGDDRRKATRAGTPGVAPLFLDADPDRLLQVLLNLLANAIKFSPPGTAVQVIVSTSPEMVHLRVVDQGRGIPAEQLDTVFNRFQQVEARDAQVKGGSGLGLAICRSIIHQHGGTIWAERNPTSGTTLCIDLPRTNRASDPLPPSSELPPGGGQTILICDKEPSLRTIVAEQLRRWGYNIVEAVSLQQAIKLAGELSVQAMLLDHDLADALTITLTQPIPIIILSEQSTEDAISLRFKPQGWVQKPFSEHHLINELSRVLRVSSSISMDRR